MAVGMRFEGKAVIVTGAGSGIGRASAVQFAREGARVVVADIDGSTAQETVDLITAAGGTALAAAGDLADGAVCEQIAARTVAEFGGIDVLVNNAGIMDRMEAAHEVSPELFDRVLRVNVTAQFLLSRACLAHMLGTGHGAIVNLASEAGLRGSAAGVAYTTSKHASVGLTKSMAVHYRNAGIRVNAVCPGGVETNVMTGIEITPNAGVIATAPYQAAIGRVAKPEELAAVICFLASDEASNVSGAIVPVDNGWSAV